jgi:hypothetical protein
LHPALGYRLTVVGMDMDLINGRGKGGWPDVAACTLPTAQRPLRVAEFDDLFRTSLRTIDRLTDTRVRLQLAGGTDLAARTQRLADTESSCCSFFTFVVTESAPGVVTLDVQVPPAYVDVLAGLVDRADAVHASPA